MKKLDVYYFFIFTPLFLLLWLSNEKEIEASLFVGLLFFYVFVYRTYIDGKRLVNKGVLLKNDIWRLMLPGFRLSHFRALYWK